MAVRAEDDGDEHVLVVPDRGFARFLDHDNYTEQGGALVTEIVRGQHLPVPSVGEHVEVLGTWALDTDHGWNEIHPIWTIRYLDRGSVVTALPPRRPRYRPDGGARGGHAGGGGCDPSYPTVCIPPPPPDLDCSDIAFRNFKVVGADPHGFDGDGDGIGCET